MKHVNYAFVGLFVLLPLLMLLFAVWVAGTTTLLCQRTEPQQVDCTLATMRWLGQSAAQETRLTHVQKAASHSYACEVKERVNGKEERVTKTCTELAIHSREGETYPGLSADLAPALNSFLDSTRSAWSVQTSSWPFALGLLAFAGVWAGVGWLFFRERTLFQLATKD